MAERQFIKWRNFMYNFIYLLRTVATILITNSHMGEIYPLSSIATGGAIGNSLFFLISGFCLFKPETTFGSWYKKRLLRLYIPVILFNICFLIKAENIFSALFFEIIFPQKYWFVCALLIMYPIFYYITTHSFENKHFLIYSMVLVCIYICIYTFLDKQSYVVETAGFCAIRFSYIFSFFLMLLGAQFRKNISKIVCVVNSGKMLPWFIANLMCYYAFIFLMTKIEFFYKIQFIETLLCVGTVVTLFLMAVGFDARLSEYNNKTLFKVIKFIGTLTFEIYIVQFVIINTIVDLNLVFPVNFIVAVPMILITAFVLNKISGKSSDLLLKKRN